MKLVMTLLVRDEEDVLREHFEYHLSRGVDEILLMDNLSTDATAEIAREYERAGVLRYCFQESDDYDQGAWVSHLARRAALDGADWIINSDADEFWWSHAGSLPDVLDSVPDEVFAISIERTNFVAREETSAPFWRRMDVRYAVSTNCFGDPLPPKVAHRASERIVVEQGNHRISIAGSMRPTASAPITILHFPLRSRIQFRNKIAKGGAAYARNTHLDPTIGATWRTLYDLSLQGRLDEVLDREVLGEAQIRSGLAEGTLVRDDRLARALESLGVTTPRAPAPSRGL